MGLDKWFHIYIQLIINNHIIFDSLKFFEYTEFFQHLKLKRFKSVNILGFAFLLFTC
jgi:hypothetical protein